MRVEGRVAEGAAEGAAEGEDIEEETGSKDQENNEL